MKNRMYPFGYKMENGAVVIVPEEAEIIRNFRCVLEKNCRKPYSKKN